jgi:hypothetical protein
MNTHPQTISFLLQRGADKEAEATVSQYMCRQDGGSNTHTYITQTHLSLPYIVGGGHIIVLLIGFVFEFLYCVTCIIFKFYSLLICFPFMLIVGLCISSVA